MKPRISNMRSYTVVALVVLLSLVLTNGIFAQGSAFSSGWWSVQTLQNLGNATAQVNATAYSSTDATTESIPVFTIPAGGGKNIYPDQIAPTGEPKISDITSGSMVVSADQPLVATVGLTNQFIGVLGVQGGTSAAIYEGTSGADIATTLQFPVAKNNYFGQTTYYFVQNAGATAANITVNFTFPGGTFPVTVENVGVGRSIVVIPPTAAPSGNTNGLGSATATSSQELAGAYADIETSRVPSKAVKMGRALTSNDAGTTLTAPNWKKGYFGNSSNLSIQGTAALTGTITYTCITSQAGGCTTGQTFNVPYATTGAGQTFNAWAYDPAHAAVPNNSAYSVQVTVNGGNAVGLIGETAWAQNQSGPVNVGKIEESFYVANAAGASTFYCPVHKENYFKGTGGTVVKPVGGATTANVEFTLVDSENKQNIGNTYFIDNLAVPTGGAVLYNVVGDNTFTFRNNNRPPTNALYSVKVTGANPIVVTSNDISTPGSGEAFDSRQYNCFAP